MILVSALVLHPRLVHGLEGPTSPPGGGLPAARVILSWVLHALLGGTLLQEGSKVLGEHERMVLVSALVLHPRLAHGLTDPASPPGGGPIAESVIAGRVLHSLLGGSFTNVTSRELCSRTLGARRRVMHSRQSYAGPGSSPGAVNVLGEHEGMIWVPALVLHLGLALGLRRLRSVVPGSANHLGAKFWEVISDEHGTDCECCLARLGKTPLDRRHRVFEPPSYSGPGGAGHDLVTPQCHKRQIRQGASCRLHRPRRLSMLGQAISRACRPCARIVSERMQRTRLSGSGVSIDPHPRRPASRATQLQHPSRPRWSRKLCRARPE